MAVFSSGLRLKNLAERTSRLTNLAPQTSESVSKSEADQSWKAMARDPDVRAQQYLSQSQSIGEMSANDQAALPDEELAIYYKVTDPIHYFTRRAEDFKRRPRESDAAFQSRKVATAKRRCARWMKKYPEHTKGKIDRASTIGWSQRRVRMAKKAKKKGKKWPSLAEVRKSQTNQLADRITLGDLRKLLKQSKALQATINRITSGYAILK